MNQGCFGSNKHRNMAEEKRGIKIQIFPLRPWAIYSLNNSYMCELLDGETQYSVVWIPYSSVSLTNSNAISSTFYG